VVEGQPGDKLYLLEEVTNPKPKTQNLFHWDPFFFLHWIFFSGSIV
jgi:hypothetical protein